MTGNVIAIIVTLLMVAAILVVPICIARSLSSKKASNGLDNNRLEQRLDRYRYILNGSDAEEEPMPEVLRIVCDDFIEEDGREVQRIIFSDDRIVRVESDGTILPQSTPQRYIDLISSHNEQYNEELEENGRYTEYHRRVWQKGITIAGFVTLCFSSVWAVVNVIGLGNCIAQKYEELGEELSSMFSGSGVVESTCSAMQLGAVAGLILVWTAAILTGAAIKLGANHKRWSMLGLTLSFLFISLAVVGLVVSLSA
jgi:hypothetical protein